MHKCVYASQTRTNNKDKAYCAAFSRELVWLELEEGTHEFGEGTSPSAIHPWKLVNTFELDKEPALEVEELVEIREKQVDRVEVDRLACSKIVGVFLSNSM